ncbi:MAG: endolytic transglycosylase MltG [Acidobacteriaceae bacterium]|nr:endolytic transglycosylase MltG [Acidobacteriaceae bacterium]
MREEALAEPRSFLRRALLLAVILTAVFAVAGAGIAAYWYLGPYRGFADETFVEIGRGMSSKEIAKELTAHGVVRSRWGFLLVRMLHPRATLQAGEYRFGADTTPWQVFEKIRRGEIFYEDFTVPEGSNMFDIASLLAGLDSVRPKDFLEAAADPELIRDIDARAPDLEGYLFPSTYRVTHQTTGRQLCRTMTAEFRKQWAALGGASDARTAHEIVTLASLVEKETAIPGERPVVAAVFANRLRLGMPLQCDPTTVYAALLENRFRGTIHRSDLASANPYNTYTHAGLPPGPIANPGAASLSAALHPVATNYLYFVAKPDGSGTHHFSATLAEHEKAVLDYRGQAR